MHKRLITFCFCLIFATGTVIAQSGFETFTGTVLAYGSRTNTRTGTALFTLELKGQTSAAQAQNYLNTLKEKGQDSLLDAIRNEDLGYFSVGANLGRTLNVVRERDNGNNRTIYIVFERWTQFAELRGGYRSLDYPFGYIELTIDKNTGKGEGKYFAAAKIRWKQNKKKGTYEIEIEDYATFPAKLLNVQSKRPLS